MLKCKIKRGGVIRVKANGTTQDLVAETAAMVTNVYNGIKQMNPAAADKYKCHLIGLLLDPNSPVWKGEA